MNLSSTAAALFLAGLVSSTSADIMSTNGADIDSIGDASRFSPQSEIDITDNGDDTCSYTLTFTYTHDPTIEAPAGECPPFKENYYDFGEERESITKYTPFDHISIDWNQCGHVPSGVWDVSHYDLHIYLKPFNWEMRQTMLCEISPVDNESCAPPENQTTKEGLGFYDVPVNEEQKIINTIDIPEPYLWLPPTGIPKSGTHAIDTRDLIGSPEWRNPSLVMGYYNGQQSFWEPMYPLTDEAVNYVKEGITYVDQTIMSLPNYYSFDYDPTTGIVVQVMKGMAEICPDDMDTGKEKVSSEDGSTEMDPPDNDDTTSSAPAVAASFVIGTLLTGLSMMIA